MRNAGVFVVGMHRGGTSAVTRLVNLLGVPTGAADAMKGASANNPTGFWEVGALTKLNERLLVELGGTWSAPPLLTGSWTRDERLRPLRDDARELFHASHPTPQWVWKDPRNTVLLPFWLDVLDVEPVVLLVCRHPREVAESLGARDGFSRRHAIALWERCMRQAIAALDGLPVLVARYDEILGAPAAWLASAGDFLGANGVDCSRAGAAEEASQFLDPGLRHTRFVAEDVAGDPAFSDPQRELFAALEGLAPTHERFDPPPLPDESPSTEPVLAERRFTEAAFAAERQRLAEARRARRKGLSKLRRQIERIEQELAAGDPVKRLQRDVGRARALLAELSAAEGDAPADPSSDESE